VGWSLVLHSVMLPSLVAGTQSKRGRIAIRLEGANLEGAHLERAVLFEAHLERANLIGAHLEYAFCFRAHLEGGNLDGADLARAENLNSAIGDARTRLPDDVTRPPGWPPFDLGAR
jgi:uncharacterized protein YjbI with pentapeptide repeats